MATNSGDGPPFNGRHVLKGIPYNSNDDLPDADASNLQQPTPVTKGSIFKNIFKGSSKPSKSEKTDTPTKSDKSGKSVNPADKKANMWTYPQHLEPPSPMQILQIMEASPEHQTKLAMEKAKNDVGLKRQGNSSKLSHSEANQSTDPVITSPTSELKWSFDGKSVLNYKEPEQSQFHSPPPREPVTTAPQGMWQGQVSVPHQTYQNQMMPRVGNEVFASTKGPAVWSNVKEVGVGPSGPSFPGGNPSQQVPEPRSERYNPEFERFNPRSHKYVQPAQQVPEPRSERYNPEFERFNPRSDEYVPSQQAPESRSERYNPEFERFDPRSDKYVVPSYPINMSILRTPYEIAEAAHLQNHPGCKSEWLVYLNGYREGQYNIMRPPNPPRMDPLFSFLPAMDPLNEAVRMASLFNLERDWTPRQEHRAKELIQASMEEFGVTGVSISLIDTSHEILKAEVGYGYRRRLIKRSESIAAHALFSTEVLVVVDTKKDWRFANNPLVVDGPKIRFFAGAPILSGNCDVVGVFCIFGREPRDNFSAVKRRSLADYGALCSAELNTLIDKSLSKESQRTLVKRAKTEVWDQTYLQSEPKPKARDRWLHEETHRMLCGEPIEEETKPINFPKSFEELWQRMGNESPDEEPVHNSVSQALGPYINGLHANVTYSSIDVNFSTPAKERDTVTSDYPLLGSDNEGPDSPPRGSSPRSESPTSGGFIWRPDSPTSQGFAGRPKSPIPANYPAPRPYSSSDLTSVEVNLPNTPAGGESSGSGSAPQTVQDVLDGTASVLQSESSEVPARRQRKKSIRSISQYEEELRRNLENGIREAHRQATTIAGSSSTAITGSYNTSEQPSTQATTPLTSFNTRMSTLQFVDTNRRAEADAAATTVAKKLGLNRVYVAEISPSSDLMMPGGASVTGMGVRILASYNCPPDMILDTDFHLQVLRSEVGAISWHDNDALPGATSKGLLIRLHSKGPYGVPRDLHTGGIVYAAIHVAQVQDGINTGITDQEQAALVNAANEMKVILFKKNDKRDRKDSASTSHIGNLITPTPVAKAEGAGLGLSIHSPAIGTPKAKVAGPQLPNLASTYKSGYEEHPNSISVQSMEEASRAVAEVLKFNMDEELNPQW
ncbi:hypothetical protein VE03_07567 [Pseudogymnoascus sp. 23342-1-I1]|nr:hypothetical protein VE03_07567 [Pseudogymnoascus sp. 23342-1-I1]